jgi:hypothetical protein
MMGRVDEPGRTNDLIRRSPHKPRMVALRLWFAFSNVVARPRRRHQASVADPPARGLVRRPVIAAFAGAVLGCLTTLYLCAFGIAPGIASALATSLICGQLLILRTSHLPPADFFIAVYGGSFVGMTPLLWRYEAASDRHFMLASALFISLSVVSGLLFGLVAEIDGRWDRRFASGYGGRSGTIAALSSFLFVAAAPLFGAEDRLFRSLSGEALDLDLTSAPLTLAACAVGLFATLTMLRWRSTATANQAERTFVASTLALIGMAILHWNNPADTRLLDAFYAGCFLGMSTPERLGGWFAPLLGPLVLTVVLVLVRTYLPGIGGSLGLAAFVTVMILAAAGFRARPEVRARSGPGWGSSAGRMRRGGTGTIVYPVSGLLALGCFVLLLLSPPRQPALDRAVIADASVPAMPGPVALPVSHQANDAPSLEAPAAGSGDLANSPELPPDDKMVAHAPSESSEQPAPEHLTVATGPDAAAQATDAPANASSGDAEPAMVEPPRARAMVDDTAYPDERLFREFMQWRASRSGTVQARPQPARTKPRPAQLVRLVTPAPSPVPPRPDRPKPASTVDPTSWPTSLHSIRPPRDASRDASRDPARAGHNVGGNPAP